MSIQANQNFLSPKMGRVERIHFVGIGGSGMCGIAEVLHNEGYQVSGSDLQENRAIQHLKSLGITIYIGHRAEQIEGADVIVCSSAILPQNPEILAAHQQFIPVIPRAAMLAELMRFRQGIAIAGTHGKTTTTSLVACLLAEGGLDPSFVIGGKLNNCQGNAQLGKSAYFVAEADESDASFLFLKPMMAVITNIDADHMSTYENNFSKLRQTFIEFLHHLPFYGLAVLCLEDPEIESILSEIERPILTYGFRSDAHYQALNWQQKDLLSQFEVRRPQGHAPLAISFRCPGKHNVLNALAAIAIATELDVSDEAIVRGLEKFEGVGRRFQLLGQRPFLHGLAQIIDDYGHHPREITSTIEAIRSVWPNKHLVQVFQPHRYTRTQALFPQFVEALSLADEVLLLDIYSAGENPILEVSSQHLVQEIKKQKQGARVVKVENLAQSLDEVVEDASIVLMQGAGNIGQLALNLVQNKGA